MTEAQPNRGLLLAEVETEIRYENSHFSSRCRVYFDLREANTILFEPVDPLNRSWEPLDPNENFLLKVAHATDAIECYYTKCTVSVTNEAGCPRFHFGFR